MRADPIRAMAAILLAMSLSGPARAQVPAPEPSNQSAPDQAPSTETGSDQPPSDPATPQLTAEQLDQLLAPIALYPDALLAQILMAASYPLEVVQADRWLQDSKNAALKGDQLTAALDQQSWDPSVKSLVPFPQILPMMDSNIDWTERLGDAFVADQPAVMASVQRLRERAEAVGKLGSTPQQAVTTDGQAITIEPPNPQVVYVPVYDPAAAYGQWPYPAFPPYSFPGYFDGAGVDGLGFGWFGVSIVAPLWGWHRWDWRHHRIDIDPDRFAALDRFHPPIRGGAWVHDASREHGIHLHGPVSPAPFAGVSSLPSSAGPRIVHGFQHTPAAEFHPPVGGLRQQTVGPQAIRPQTIHPQAVPPGFGSSGRGGDIRFQAPRGPITPQVIRPQAVRPQMVRSQAMPPAFRPSGRGVDIRSQAARGSASRMSTPMFRPSAGAPGLATRNGGMVAPAHAAPR